MFGKNRQLLSSGLKQAKSLHCGQLPQPSHLVIALSPIWTLDHIMTYSETLASFGVSSPRKEKNHTGKH
jgi:hypothetical protein